MVARDGFEPPTPAFSGQRSTKLSYLATSPIVTEPPSAVKLYAVRETRETEVN